MVQGQREAVQGEIHRRGESARVASQGKGGGGVLGHTSRSASVTTGKHSKHYPDGPHSRVSRDAAAIIKSHTAEDKARSGSSTHDTEQGDSRRKRWHGNGTLPLQQRKVGEGWFDSRVANTSSQDWPCNVQPQCTGKMQVLVPNHSELQSSSSMAHQTRAPYKHGPVDCTGSALEATRQGEEERLGEGTLPVTPRVSSPGQSWRQLRRQGKRCRHRTPLRRVHHPGLLGTQPMEEGTKKRFTLRNQR